MVDPLFWLGLSILLVAISLTAVLVSALPALRELARAARSAEKLFDTLNRELPPTLEAIRLTGMEISDLTDDVSEGVQSAGRVVQQVDQSISGVKKQARKAQSTTRSLFVGIRTAWKTLSRPSAPRRSQEHLRAGERALEFEENYTAKTSFSSDETYLDDPEYKTQPGEAKQGISKPEAEDRRLLSWNRTADYLLEPSEDTQKPTKPTKQPPRDYSDED